MIYALSALFAVLSGWYDAWCIKRNLAINHVERWILRAGAVAIFVMADCAIRDYPALRMIPIAIGCAFLFSAVFRLTLNLWRKKPWRYMGAMFGRRGKDASRYDGTFHWLAWRLTGSQYSSDWKTSRFGHPVYPERLPAFLAYSFELVATLILLNLGGAS